MVYHVPDVGDPAQRCSARSLEEVRAVFRVDGMVARQAIVLGRNGDAPVDLALYTSG
jgi:hypothetical protein